MGTDTSHSPARRPCAALLLTLGALALAGIAALLPAPAGWEERTSPRRAATGPARPRAPVPAPAPVEPAPAPAEPAPEEAVRPDPGTLALTRIVLDPTDASASFAVIDGKAVRGGDRIGGWTVLSVERERVLLGEEGERVLTVGGEEAR